jgi:hypothetical protein
MYIHANNKKEASVKEKVRRLRRESRSLGIKEVCGRQEDALETRLARMESVLELLVPPTGNRPSDLNLEPMEQLIVPTQTTDESLSSYQESFQLDRMRGSPFNIISCELSLPESPVDQYNHRDMCKYHSRRLKKVNDLSLSSFLNQVGQFYQLYWENPPQWRIGAHPTSNRNCHYPACGSSPV